MFKRVLLLLLMAAVMVVPGVAENVIYDETFTWSDADIFESHTVGYGSSDYYYQSQIYITPMLSALEPTQLMSQAPAYELKTVDGHPNGGWPVTFTSNGVVIGSGDYYYFQYSVGDTLYTQSVVDFFDVDWSAVVSGKIAMSAPPTGYNYVRYNHERDVTNNVPYKLASKDTPGYAACFWDGTHGFIDRNIPFYTSVSYDWANRVRVTDTGRVNNITRLDLIRDAVPGYTNYSSMYITDAHGFNYTSVNSDYDVMFTFLGDRYPLDLRLNTHLNHWFNTTITFGETPNDPTALMRTGTVTMTDNNGTTITGFEVTAVNHYTGQSYTVSTETDVAVMNLPMDRSITIRNPQTGEYEDAPIGYYRFFGQSPGYKMLYEEGIQVSVMPEKYGSYQLCDIRVTSESGYLTGQHQFQIRSRSDNSILQTGTISAKSATTGEWYNTTVSGGIATLILPYDTSNTQSQYAGNYYVYATSPGYEDSNYGTQIVVMPHTVSEIHNILLTPIGGVPPAGNVTLRIQAFSETGQGVVNAEIFIAGVLGEGSSVWDTYTASSTGYLTVSVPGNSTYDIVASGAGYYDSARRVQVFAEDPALIEIKLYLSGAPTVPPTTQPTGWPTTQPTPTQTSPPIPDDNIIGMSVKGLAKGFGIDYDTALLLFGMMIIFGAGGIVMNSVKGGAMEFIAGSIVGTFVAFALGLIPIWIFIIIAVVFGAYVLRVFLQGGGQ